MKKLVKFENGTFGIRKWFFPIYRFYDFYDHSWESRNYFAFECCMVEENLAKQVLAKFNSRHSVVE